MLSNNIKFKNFSLNKSNKKILNIFKKLIAENNEILNSLKNNYKSSYNKKIILKLKKFSEIHLIGIGGSILGSKAIYSFLKKKIQKKFLFSRSFSRNKI